MPTMQCHCGLIYQARSADLKRGWGLSCSKSCAAIRRDFGRKPAKQIDGDKVRKTKPKPSSYRPNDNRRYDDGLGYTYERYLDEVHPFSDEAIQG